MLVTKKICAYVEKMLLSKDKSALKDIIKDMFVSRKGHVLYKLWITELKKHYDTLLKDI